MQKVIGKEPDEEIPLNDMLHFVKQMIDNERTETEKYNHNTKRPRPKARTRRVSGKRPSGHGTFTPARVPSKQPGASAKKAKQAAVSAARVSKMSEIFGPLLSILFHDDGGGRSIDDFVEFTDTGFRMGTDKDGRGFKIHPSSYEVLNAKRKEKKASKHINVGGALPIKAGTVNGKEDPRAK